MYERFVSAVSAKTALYKYSSFPFLSQVCDKVHLQVVCH